MNARDFFSLCLGLGFGFSLVSALFGGGRLGHLHLPHVLTHGHAAGGGHGGGGRAGGWLNPSSAAAFLMWFGAAGYLLDRFAGWGWAMAAIAAAPFGVIGAGLVFWFLARVVWANEKPLDPADYDMTGTLGKLSGPLRERGTGEMIFTQQGRRLGVPVRSEAGAALPSGTEVIVTRYEGGIAYVRTWEELQK